MYRINRNLPDDGGFSVASGSLPPGVSDDFYGQLADIVKKRKLNTLVKHIITTY